MALPADFNKIFGSTATGGLTPISNVNYAKGWEFVGSNPPTKNDFSYLQNLSDLKSQWLYSNKLNLANPLSEISSAGTQGTARTNLGLGTASTKNVGTSAGQIPDMSAFQSGSGYQRLPSGYILQWGSATAGNSASTGVSNTFPIPFPTAVVIITTGQIDPSYTSAQQPTAVGIASPTNTGFIAKTSSANNDAFNYLAIGY